MKIFLQHNTQLGMLPPNVSRRLGKVQGVTWRHRLPVQLLQQEALQGLDAAPQRRVLGQVHQRVRRPGPPLQVPLEQQVAVRADSTTCIITCHQPSPPASTTQCDTVSNSWTSGKPRYLEQAQRAGLPVLLQCA